MARTTDHGGFVKNMLLVEVEDDIDIYARKSPKKTSKTRTYPQT